MEFSVPRSAFVARVKFANPGQLQQGGAERWLAGVVELGLVGHGGGGGQGGAGAGSVRHRLFYLDIHSKSNKLKITRQFAQLVATDWRHFGLATVQLATHHWRPTTGDPPLATHHWRPTTGDRHIHCRWSAGLGLGVSLCTGGALGAPHPYTLGRLDLGDLLGDHHGVTPLDLLGTQRLVVEAALVLVAVAVYGAEELPAPTGEAGEAELLLAGGASVLLLLAVLPVLLGAAAGACLSAGGLGDGGDSGQRRVEAGGGAGAGEGLGLQGEGGEGGAGGAGRAEAGGHVGGRRLLLLHDVLVADRAQPLAPRVAVEAAAVLAERRVVLLHVAVPAVHPGCWLAYLLKKVNQAYKLGRSPSLP